MTKRVLKLTSLVVALGLTGIASTAPALALPIFPGTTVSPTNFGSLAGETLVTSLSGSYSGATISGDYTTQVLRTAGGTLDFVIQIFNDLACGGGNLCNAIERVTDGLFAGTWLGFAPNVGFASATPTLVSGVNTLDNVDETLDASTIGFNFGAGFAIPPGANSVIMVIRTSAMFFTTGNIGILNSSTDTVQGFIPAVPGPIVGAGLPGLIAACGGLLALARRRRKQLA